MRVTFWKNYYEVETGVCRDVTWDELCAKLTTRQTFRGSTFHPGWSPAEFSGKRCLENVKRAYVLCLDFDKGQTRIDDALAVWEGVALCWHTTRSHKPESPSFRVILRLTRDVSAFEFYALWERVAARAGNVDPAPKDPSRFWYLPGCDAESEFLSGVQSGAMLDVDEWLAMPVAQPRIEHAPQVEAQGDIEKRAIAYIAKMPEAISGSNGHGATWDVAITLAKGFGLDEERTFAILWSEYNPRCQPPWTESELRHKAKGASAATRVPTGYKLDDDSVWKPQPWKRPPRDEDQDYVPEPPPGFHELDQAQNDNGAEASERTGSDREPGDDAEETEAPDPYARVGLMSLQDMFIQVWERAKSKKEARGFTFGIQVLDDLIGGLRCGNVTTLGAKTSFGKTSLANLVADKNINAPCLEISLEDGAELYGRRMIAPRTGINALRLRDNDLDDREIAKIGVAAGLAETRPFFWEAIGKPVEDIAKAIDFLCKETGVKLVIVDYLQRLRTKKARQDRRNEIDYGMGMLSDAIKGNHAAGLWVSQLSRNNKIEPDLDDLKESGDIEIMSEHVILGWRVEAGEDQFGGKRFERYVKVPKNKDGPLNSEAIRLNFNEVTASFVSDIGSQGWRDDPLKNPQEDPFSDFDTPTEDDRRYP